jgi:hypothetical protein
MLNIDPQRTPLYLPLPLTLHHYSHPLSSLLIFVCNHSISLIKNTQSYNLLQSIVMTSLLMPSTLISILLLVLTLFYRCLTKLLTVVQIYLILCNWCHHLQFSRGYSKESCRAITVLIFQRKRSLKKQSFWRLLWFRGLNLVAGWKPKISRCTELKVIGPVSTLIYLV